MLKRVRREEGMAMIVAILIAAIVLLMSIFAMQLAVHNIDQSSYDRKRLISVTAAESGVNDYYSYLANLMSQSTPNLSSIACSIHQDLATGPNLGSYDAHISFYNSAGVQTACPPASGFVPSAVRITSIGSAPGEVSRRMESYATLAPVIGGTTTALFSNGSTSLSNKMTLNGYDGSDADAYVSGNLTISQNQSFAGDLNVQGTVTINNQTTVAGNLWALGNVSLKGQTVITGDTYSTTGSISNSNPATIQGVAKAAGNVSGSGTFVGGKFPNTVGIGNPPTLTFPSLTFSATQQTDWLNFGFQFVPFTDCTAAKTYLAGLNSSSPKTLVQISGGCSLALSGITVNLYNDVAIVTDGSICLTNHNIFQAQNGPRSLYLIVEYGTSGSTCSSGARIDVANQTEFDDLTGDNVLSTFMYAPGQINLANLTGLNGQVYGTPVNATNQTTINYLPVYVPGISTITGFRQNVQYIREVES